MLIVVGCHDVLLCDGLLWCCVGLLWHCSVLFVFVLLRVCVVAYVCLLFLVMV